MTKNMDYNPEDDTWTDDCGRTYIKNMFKPDTPQWIDTSTSSWSVSYGGFYHTIDWDVLKQRPLLLEAFKKVATTKLKASSSSYIAKIKHLLNSLVPSLHDDWKDFGDIPTNELQIIWVELNNSNKITLREFYQQMAMLGIGGARSDVAIEIKHWKARDNVQNMKDVLQWHETRGALTSSEEKVLRETLSSTGKGLESVKEQSARIFGWLALDTLKRSSQILEIRSNGVREVPGKNGGSEWFVEIPPVKFQTGLPLRWWRISEQLAHEIKAYSKREWVPELQERFDRLIVWDVPSLQEHGVVSSSDAKGALTKLISKRKVMSPRTGKWLHVTPRRIRHTGATRLAFQGVSRDLIQEILEHDSSESAQAYIDAIGSEIIPAIEKAGRQMGNIFFELNKSYFQGRVIHDISDKPPVVVPEFTATPIIVGTCSRDTLKDGVCPKHPFLSCYDGCSCFFAWNNPDPHGKALNYFEKEISRWEKSIEAAQRESKPHLIADKTLQSYQRAATAAKEVLTQIDKGEPR